MRMRKRVLRNRKEVIKHSGAVQIQNNITLLQRRAWNVLLANAYDDLPIDDEYKIRVKELMEVLEFESKNENYLKEALKALATCGVEWNILGKGGTPQWGVTTLLAQAIIENGICTYAYSPELRKRLYNPKMYARISLSLQNKFDSKHAQALWELCVDYLDETKNYGATPFLELDEYRKLMGLADSTYAHQFKILNRDVIKPSINEINQITDFNVAVEYQRQSRKVVAIKFKIKREIQIPTQSTRQAILFPELEDMPAVVRELKDAGLPVHDAWTIWQQGFDYVDVDKRPSGVEFDTYIREKLHLLKQQDTAKVKSRTGFLLQAIKGNYVNPAYKASQKAETVKRNQVGIQQLRREKERLEDDRRVAINQLCSQIANDMPEFVNEVLDAILSEQPFLRQFCDREKTPLENYQNNAMIAGSIDAELMKQHPDRFTAIDDEYDAKIAEIDRQIAVLEVSG